MSIIRQNLNIFGAGSILSPALSKNVVTVGASEASPSSAGLADDVDEVWRFVCFFVSALYANTSTPLV